MSENSAQKLPPWHRGELELQAHVGALERMAEIGQRNIRDYLTDQHKDFFPLLPFVVLGSVDGNGNPWATLRAGRPGFLRAADDTHLDVDVRRDTSDPAEAGMNDGDPVGILGIEITTRRRNRMNGRIVRTSTERFTVAVEQAYGNCPKYIQVRQPSFVREPDAVLVTGGDVAPGLTEKTRDLIANADTFFVATYVDREEGGRQVDVSHRGGKVGFVRIDEDDVLTIPDFVGNKFFNTLGNILLNPRAGLVFVDFLTGDMLHLTGRAEVIIDSDEISLYHGAERLWRFRTEKAVLRRDALPMRFAFNDEGWSPNLSATGDWISSPQAKIELRPLRTAPKGSARSTRDVTSAPGEPVGEFRKLIVSRVVDETEDIRSIYLRGEGGALASFAPGQHLQFKLPLSGHSKPLVRHYSLSDFDPSPLEYRIGVRRAAGEASTSGSNYIHAEIGVGSTLLASLPRGEFTLDPQGRRPVALISVGVGITPVLSMLKALAAHKFALPVWFIYGARSGAGLAYASEVRAICDGSSNFRAHFRLSRPQPTDVCGRDYDSAGRIDATLVRSLIGSDAEIMICGPINFMRSLKGDLEYSGVPSGQIHFESFGTTSAPQNALGREGATVRFVNEKAVLTWTSKSQNILELAEAADIDLPFSCRAGDCGACEQHLIEGEVEYATQPFFKVRPKHILACQAQPTTDIVLGPPEPD